MSFQAQFPDFRKIFLKFIKISVTIILIFTNEVLCLYCKAHISLNQRERRMYREGLRVFPATPVGAGALCSMIKVLSVIMNKRA